MWQLIHLKESNWSYLDLGTIILTTCLRNPMWWSEVNTVSLILLLIGILLHIGVHYLICFVCDYALSFNHFNCNNQIIWIIHIQYCYSTLFDSVICEYHTIPTSHVSWCEWIQNEWWIDYLQSDWVFSLKSIVSFILVKRLRSLLKQLRVIWLIVSHDVSY